MIKRSNSHHHFNQVPDVKNTPFKLHPETSCPNKPSKRRVRSKQRYIKLQLKRSIPRKSKDAKSLHQYVRDGEFLDLADLKVGDILIMAARHEYYGTGLRRYMFLEMIPYNQRVCPLFFTIVTNNGKGSQPTDLKWYLDLVSFDMPAEAASIRPGAFVSPVQAIILEPPANGQIYAIKEEVECAEYKTWLQLIQDKISHLLSDAHRGVMRELCAQMALVAQGTLQPGRFAVEDANERILDAVHYSQGSCGCEFQEKLTRRAEKLDNRSGESSQVNGSSTLQLGIQKKKVFTGKWRSRYNARKKIHPTAEFCDIATGMARHYLCF